MKRAGALVIFSTCAWVGFTFPVWEAWIVWTATTGAVAAAAYLFKTEKSS
jgi:hypothetical protein